jgi:electron transfer flavoprotein alpha subunit
VRITDSGKKAKKKVSALQHGYLLTSPSTVNSLARTIRVFRPAFSRLNSSVRPLVLADHDGTKLNPATLNTIQAASELGAPVEILLTGHNCGELAKELAAFENVAKVHVADDPKFAHILAETQAQMIIEQHKSRNYTHIFAPASTNGKNTLPRVAGSLGVSQLSEVTRVESHDTFVRPIYAGNAMATVQSLDAVKVITVRATAFEKVKKSDKSAEIAAGENAFPLCVLRCCVLRKKQQLIAAISKTNCRNSSARKRRNLTSQHWTAPLSLSLVAAA